LITRTMLYSKSLVTSGRSLKQASLKQASDLLEFYVS